MNDHIVSDKLEPFDESRVSPRAHPHSDTQVDFDWQAVEAALGELPPEDRERLADALSATLEWVVAPAVEKVRNPSATVSGRRCVTTAGRRALVLLWWLGAERFGGGATTVEDLGRILRTNATHLHRISAELRRRFGPLRPL